MKNGFVFIHRKAVAVVVGMVFLLTLFAPMGGSEAYAFDPDLFRVDQVDIFREYDSDRSAISHSITISGVDLKDAPVRMRTPSGYVELTDRIFNDDDMLQFRIDENQIGNQIRIGGVNIDINEGSMPTLTGINRKVVSGEGDLVIQGTNLKLDDITEISAYYSDPEGREKVFDRSCFSDNNEVTIENLVGNLGNQDIKFKKDETKPYTFPSEAGHNVRIIVEYTYYDQFKIIENLIIDNLNMYPNRGEEGDIVFFEANELNDYDVFFVRKNDGTDPYTEANRGKNKTFRSNIEGTEKDVLTVQVPKLPVGEYFVVLTNSISPGQDPMEAVVKEMIVGTAPDYKKFTIVDASNKSQIFSVEPASGPDTGSETTITGQYLGTLNIPEFTPDNNDILIPAPVPECDELVLQYSGGTYDGETIKSATRKIRVIIGNKATFSTVPDGSSYDVNFESGLDVIKVRTPEVSDAHIDPKKDVTIEIDTILTRDDDSIIEFNERAVLENGYTFIPSKVAPVIDSILPEKIQVVENGAEYQIPEDRVIAIYGSDFLVNRYTDDQGNNIIHYPVVKIGDMLLDPNNESIQMQVFKADGTEVDGTAGNELGNKILVMLPAGREITQLGPCDLSVTNPLRNSETSGLSAVKYDAVEIVCPGATLCPLVNMVTPDIIPVDGNIDIVVEGNNFRNDVRLFLDGNEIEDFERATDGQKITFTAPPGREGVVQLQVMNPGGGMDTWYITYVSPYTEPAIIDFAPKAGRTGTLVQITGQNFLKPDPTPPEEVVHKLIGTRVLLEGEDVNEYNRDPADGRIVTRNYTNGDEPILSIQDKALKLADYAYAIILELEGSDPHDFYRLEQKRNGNIMLTDGARDNYNLELNDTGDGIVAVSVNDGKKYAVSVSNEGISVAGPPDRTFNMKTIYQVEDGIITGCRVQVLDSSTIQFYVPVLEAEGFYDLTIINPDTKSDTRYDENGFYYFKQPVTKPQISNIEPEQGSVEGNYCIDITGTDFFDNGRDKTRVYINGTEIADEDVEVNISRTMLRVKVPPYPGDLREEYGTDHLSVPVVIVNPDGGSASRANGFTYIIPGSKPQIQDIVPDSGSASGGEVVEIIGVDFRYFEPYDDVNRNQQWDEGETYVDINKNGEWDSDEDKDQWYQEDGYYDSPILPQVLFNNKPATILDFANGYLKVLTPPGTPGKAEVVVVNNDSGISDTHSYTYISSEPAISDVIPDIGSKFGGEYIEIHGSNMQSNIIQVYENGEWKLKNMVLLCFGENSNHYLEPGDVNFGRLINGRASAAVDGVSVSYIDGEGLDILLEESGIQYSLHIDDYDGSARYINLKELKIGSGDTYECWEMLRVEIANQRLLLERGYSPETDLLDSTLLNARTASSRTVGEVLLRLINPDGSSAESKFTYMNPASHPTITNMERDDKSPIEIDGVNVLKVNYKSLSNISISGTDFRDKAVIQVGDLLEVAPEDITYDLPGNLSFIMPEMPESVIGKMYRVIVMNPDGGVASSDKPPTGLLPIYIQFTSGDSMPEISEVIPAIGPDTGETVVTIKGSDFRTAMEGYSGNLHVYFGAHEVPAADITFIDSYQIKVVTPAGDMGPQYVRVENPDGEMAVMEDGFTYISTPTISSIINKDNSNEIDHISINGGEEIMIKGSGFTDSVQVIFNPVLKPAEDENTGSPVYCTGTVDVDGRESSVSVPYILEAGAEGSDIEVVDSETITVTTPAGQKGEVKIIVINQDGGCSGDYDDLDYDWPQIDTPTGVVAEIVHNYDDKRDRYIKVHWNEVEGARVYDIYVTITKDEEYLGSTEMTTYVFEDIEPNTNYQFVVTAIGEYGSSIYSEESNKVKTGKRVGAPDDDGGLVEKTVKQQYGNSVNIVIGEKDYGRDIRIDLQDKEYAGAERVEVSIPSSIIDLSRSRYIEIKGPDYNLTFKPDVFRNSMTTQDRYREGCGLRFIISAHNGTIPDAGIVVSPVYDIQIDYYRDDSITPVRKMYSSLVFSMHPDSTKISMRRYNSIKMAKYDAYFNKWNELENGMWANDQNLYFINEAGRYALIGSRR